MCKSGLRSHTSTLPKKCSSPLIGIGTFMISMSVYLSFLNTFLPVTLNHSCDVFRWCVNPSETCRHNWPFSKLITLFSVKRPWLLEFNSPCFKFMFWNGTSKIWLTGTKPSDAASSFDMRRSKCPWVQWNEVSLERRLVCSPFLISFARFSHLTYRSDSSKH